MLYEIPMNEFFQQLIAFKTKKPTAFRYRQTTNIIIPVCTWLQFSQSISKRFTMPIWDHKADFSS